MSEPIITMAKQFSKELHAENDELCRKAALGSKSMLLHLGLDTLIDNPDQYGVDLIGYREGEIVCYVEVERKHGWSGPNFGFKTLHIPLRKKKFCWLDKPTFFVVFNKECTHGAIAHDTTLIEAKIVSLWVKYEANAQFFDIGVDEVSFIKV